MTHRFAGSGLFAGLIFICLAGPLAVFHSAEAQLPTTAGPTVGALVRTLSVDFIRVKTPAEGDPEETAGRLYYSAPDRILVHVRKPLEQIFEVEKEHLRIYYPGDGRAFDIISDSPQMLPFFQALLGSLEEDFGLSASGYTLGRHETRQDTVFTYWAPPKEARKTLGTTVLARDGHGFQRLEMTDSKGRLMARYGCAGGIEHSDLLFPGRIQIDIVRGPQKGSEVTTYSALTLNEDLPSWVTAFHLPDDAEVKDLR